MMKRFRLLMTLSLLTSTSIQASPIEADLGASNVKTSAFKASPNALSASLAQKTILLQA
jgi:hypothetical protein